MNCPICSREMQEGGMVAEGIAGWVPIKEFRKKGLKSLFTPSIVHRVGKKNLLINQVRIPNAFYCEHCQKIVGVFDITKDPYD